MLGYRHSIVEITDPAVITKSGTALHPIVSHTGDHAEAVEGTLYTISAAELAKTDAYEVADYKRIQVRLASGTDAWVYVKA